MQEELKISLKGVKTNYAPIQALYTLRGFLTTIKYGRSVPLPFQPDQDMRAAWNVKNGTYYSSVCVDEVGDVNELKVTITNASYKPVASWKKGPNKPNKPTWDKFSFMIPNNGVMKKALVDLLRKHIGPPVYVRPKPETPTL